VRWTAARRIARRNSGQAWLVAGKVAKSGGSGVRPANWMAVRCSLTGGATQGEAALPKM
jgi:hypothetical protein